jgi:hypothetical protein
MQTTDLDRFVGHFSPSAKNNQHEDEMYHAAAG